MNTFSIKQHWNHVRQTITFRARLERRAGGKDLQVHDAGDYGSARSAEEPRREGDDESAECSQWSRLPGVASRPSHDQLDGEGYRSGVEQIVRPPRLPDRKFTF